MRLQELAGALAEIVGDDRVCAAMCHEDRYVTVGRVRFVGQGVRLRQIAGKRQDPGQPPRVAQTGVQGNDATLGEAGKHDSPVRNAA
ncbi:MAG: hypothetical protein AW07_00576 [Candidatus Accumulibacter sp. SK-11]|nr:MAG: hypothetical protein AW07_00576 [Candidatus Accumulibacter sp. SK-11]